MASCPAAESIPEGLEGHVVSGNRPLGGPTNNNIYMLASVVPPGRNTTDVMFVRSTDGGVTFSAPQRSMTIPLIPSKWHWFGTFSVAPMVGSMLSGMTRAMLPITQIPSYFIP